MAEALTAFGMLLGGLIVWALVEGVQWAWRRTWER